MWDESAEWEGEERGVKGFNKRGGTFRDHQCLYLYVWPQTRDDQTWQPTWGTAAFSLGPLIIRDPDR